MKEKIKKKLIGIVPYIVIHTVVFFSCPYVIKDTGSAMFFLLFAMPGILLLSGFVYGIREGFCIIPAILTALAFIPTIYLFYNASAWIYTWMFGGFELAGIGIGSLFYKKKVK